MERVWNEFGLRKSTWPADKQEVCVKLVDHNDESLIFQVRGTWNTLCATFEPHNGLISEIDLADLIGEEISLFWAEV